MQSVPDAVVEALRDGHAIGDTKLEALRALTTAIVQQRGVLNANDLETFFAAGYARAHILEVIVGVAMKTISKQLHQPCCRHAARRSIRLRGVE